MTTTDEKISSLEFAINKLSSNLDKVDKKIEIDQNVLIYIITIPFAIFILLSIIKPSFVSDGTDKDGKKISNTYKSIKWTLIFSIILGSIYYLYAYYRNVVQ